MHRFRCLGFAAASAGVLALTSCEQKATPYRFPSPTPKPAETPRATPLPVAEATPTPPRQPTPEEKAAPAPTPMPSPSPTAMPGRAVDVPNDNADSPHIAVYKGSVNGVENPYGAISNAAYAAWLNRNVVWAEDTQPHTFWENMSGQGWQLAPWAEWKRAVKGRKLILHIGIIPGVWDRSGTINGIDAGMPVSHEDGAAGKYNEVYKTLAANLVKYDLADSILRLGCEFNGGWFPWRVKGDEEAKAFAGYFRQIVTTMRGVPGAEKLQFDWNVGHGWCSFDPEKAWPGDEYVDYVGVDVYDDCYAPNTYPFRKNATESEKTRIRKSVWDDFIITREFGLNYWSEFARKHHKQMSIPEWGVDNKPDGHGSGDDPNFIEQMHKFINDRKNNVGYYSYFDYQAGDGHHQLAPKSDGTIVTEFPESAEKFRKLFSLPPAPGQQGKPVAPLPVKPL